MAANQINKKVAPYQPQNVRPVWGGPTMPLSALAAQPPTQTPAADEETTFARGLLDYYGNQQQATQRALGANEYAYMFATANAQALLTDKERLLQDIANDEALRQIEQDKATKEEEIKALEKLKIPIRKIAEPPPYLAPPTVAIPDRPVPRPSALGSLFAAIAGIVAPESAGAIAASNIKGAIDAASQAYQDALQKRQMTLDALLRQWEALKEHMHDLQAFQKAQYDAEFDKDLRKLELDSAIAKTKAELKGLGVAENLENAIGVKRRALAAKLAMLQTANQQVDLLKSNIERLSSMDEKLEGYTKDVMLQVLKAIEDRAKEASLLNRQIFMEEKRTEDRKALYEVLQALLMERFAFQQGLIGRRQINVAKALGRGQATGIDPKLEAQVDAAYTKFVTPAYGKLRKARSNWGVYTATQAGKDSDEFRPVHNAEAEFAGNANRFIATTISAMQQAVKSHGPIAMTVNSELLRKYGRNMAQVMDPYDFVQVMDKLIRVARGQKLIPGANVWKLPTFSDTDRDLILKFLVPGHVPYDLLDRMMYMDPAEYDAALKDYTYEPLKRTMKKVAFLYWEMLKGSEGMPTKSEAQGSAGTPGDDANVKALMALLDRLQPKKK